MCSIEHKKNNVENFIQIPSIYYNTAIAFACFCVIQPFQSTSFSKTGLLRMISNPNNYSVSVREIF